MFSIRAWIVLLLALGSFQAAGQDIGSVAGPDPNPLAREAAMTTGRTDKRLRFEHRTFATEPEARAYADKLNEALGAELRSFEPWTLSRGRDKGRWTVAQHDFR